ncbi:hypothetical protein D3C87_1851720 [compost metagenome]
MRPHLRQETAYQQPQHHPAGAQQDPDVGGGRPASVKIEPDEIENGKDRPDGERCHHDDQHRSPGLGDHLLPVEFLKFGLEAQPAKAALHLPLTGFSARRAGAGIGRCCVGVEHGSRAS